MTIEAKQQYLKAIKERYKNSKKKEKTLILNELCINTGYSRNYAIRFLNTNQTSGPRKKAGAKNKYPLERLLPHVKALYFAMEQPGAQKLKAALPHWLPFYKAVGFTEQIYKLLLEISESSLERILKHIRKAYGLSGTKRSLLLKNRIPIQTIDWNIKGPGFCEVDTVLHCGNAISGEYAHTLTVTDVFSAWTENRAFYTKAAIRVIEQVRDIEANIPFELLGIDSDNGSEFLNYDFFEFLEKRKKPIAFTRSRPYKKNDQCYVEQKNYTHVRCLFGYDRIEKKHMVDLMNDIYKNYWNPLQNFFMPTTKLIRKTRVGAKIKKEYQKPKTPYQRLRESADISAETKRSLEIRYLQMNPFELKAALEYKLKGFFQELRRHNFRAIA